MELVKYRVVFRQRHFHGLPVPEGAPEVVRKPFDGIVRCDDQQQVLSISMFIYVIGRGTTPFSNIISWEVKNWQ
jgi:hypothetical protein